ncbi:hypothetical protein ASG49_16115 [Marmoricola sp. Leaf446]|uniref:sensor histidine kinase n=1 Tax=Marmoricola sp. Leaf446 TaxID=1736379 RepID=UPI0006FC68ED|nr:HAMP domain-containing sensor histidine kinase [Marmoricola sp. Leaf446]KQT89307.1 hypothetical protein ASG49_16115 [Marmoricola sp. Leaf446]
MTAARTASPLATDDGATVDGAPVEGADADGRLDCVLQVLGGASVAGVARGAGLEPAVVHRWVRLFTDAGAAGLANRPDPTLAQQRDRFLAAFAHEIRTPLAVAQGWTDILADGDLPEDMTASTVGKLGAALALLAERTQEVEYLAAASLGRLRVTRRAVSALALVPDGEVAPSGDLDARVDTDPGLAARVVRDLWTAAAMTPRPTRRELQVRDTGMWVELRVVRTGEPIPARTLHALFEPFDRNDDATGVSTGLYLARALSVALGGTVGLEQDSERAVFWVRLPSPEPRTLR